jgi:hypothetical protein
VDADLVDRSDAREVVVGEIDCTDRLGLWP